MLTGKKHIALAKMLTELQIPSISRLLARKNKLAPGSPSLSLSDAEASPIRCLNPKVIINPLLFTFIDAGFTILVKHTSEKCVHFNLAGKPSGYVRKKASTSNLSLDLDSIAASVLLDPSTGEIKPAYVLAPCGHCSLCTASKQNTYALRVAAELQHTPGMPILVTLTYADAHLPADGVRVRDVQLFFKRLRTALDRKGVTHSLRYLYCGEYGTEHRRPHYHVILFGFPFHGFYCFTDAVRFIERCWSVYRLALSKEGKMVRYLVDQYGNVAGSYESKALADRGYKIETQWATEPIGHVFVKKCDSGVARYLAKYVAKSVRDCFIGHEDCDYFQRSGASIGSLTEPFIYQSVHGGGLGAAYFLKTFVNWPELLLRPECLIMDVVSGKKIVASSKMPFNVAFPSVSRVLGVDVYDDFRLALCASCYLEALELPTPAIAGWLRLMRIPEPRMEDIALEVESFGTGLRFAKKVEALSSLVAFMEDRYAHYPFAIMEDILRRDILAARDKRYKMFEESPQTFNVKNIRLRYEQKDQTASRHRVVLPL